MSSFKYKISVYLPIIIALALVAGMLLGIRLAPKSSLPQSVVKDVSGYNKISDILSYIENDYVDTVNIDKVSDEAITRMLQNLDPHSQYIPASDFEEVNEELEGNFEGIGIQFRIEKDTVMVITPVPGGPSEKVGIRAGDRIVTVGKDTIAGVGITNKDVLKQLKGPRGTKVNVGVLRRSIDGLLEFTITRDIIPTYSVDVAYMIDDSIGFIKLSKFSTSTREEVDKAIRNLKSEGMTNLILDLRNNSGGYLQAAIDVAEQFLSDKKLIVYTEGKNRPKSYAYASNYGNFQEGKLIILIDEGSASASEIVAGAIQDNDRGTIIGRRSFGKGLVQEQLNLYDGSAIRLTVARYYTPTGRCIQKPYKNGTEEYYREFHDRFKNGEVLSADSIHFADSLKYVTPAGKIVYGGGGIMPDVFIPIESGTHLNYYNRLINKSIIYDFAFEFTDANRDELSKYNDYKAFDTSFKVTEKMFDDLVTMAEKNGIPKDAAGISRMKKDIMILLKALIARNILDDAGFYPIYLKNDETFLKALGLMKNTSHNQDM